MYVCMPTGSKSLLTEEVCMLNSGTVSTTAEQGIPPSLLDNNIVPRLYLSWDPPSFQLNGYRGFFPRH